MNTVKFANAVGRRKIATSVDVNMRSVSNAVTRGVFPPAWYISCSRLAAQIGIDCPPSLFGMKGLDPLRVDGIKGNQGNACITKGTGVA